MHSDTNIIDAWYAESIKKLSIKKSLASYIVVAIASIAVISAS